ncbi:MAG TPA: HDOD domain-containing protein [Planctomycetes bacterium]|nr:HDOD domain-containing protein [Planctomycetota bacterium]
MTLSPLSNLARHDKIKREVQQKSELIPSLPDVVTEILGLLNNNQGAELKDFEKHLQKDASLVARMLRVVNSPFYGMPQPVNSIKEAVMILGFRSLRSLVLAATTANYLERNFSCFGHSEKGLWIHSLCVASGARTLAKETRQKADIREGVFVAGLLHDIGKMLLGPFLAESNDTVSMYEGEQVDIETTLLGMNHTEAGELIAEKWNLGAMVQTAIKAHHGTELPEGFENEVALIRLADNYAKELGKGYQEGLEPEVRYLQADLDQLKLDEDKWDDAKFEMKEAMETAIATLNNLGTS